MNEREYLEDMADLKASRDRWKKRAERLESQIELHGRIIISLMKEGVALRLKMDGIREERDKWQARAKILGRAITQIDTCDFCVHFEGLRIHNGWCPYYKDQESCLAFVFDEARFKEDK